MSKKNLIIIGLLTFIAILLGGYFYLQSYLNAPLLTKEDIEKYKAIAAKQNEDAFLQWEFQENRFKEKNELKNVYFGDLHVHSSFSFDAYIFNTRFDPDESYAFARGKPLINMYGETMQISRPLDFAAITDLSLIHI